MNRDGRLGVGIVGAGRVGPVLGAALAGAGHALVGITSGSDRERVEAILPDAAARGAIPLAIHPAIAFTGTSMDLRQLHGAFAAVTAPGPVLPIAQALAVEMGCEPVVIAEEDRAAYAEGIATATTFSREIVRQSTGLLSRAGVPEPGLYLSSLVHSTIDHALAGSRAARDAEPPSEP